MKSKKFTFKVEFLVEGPDRPSAKDKQAILRNTVRKEHKVIPVFRNSVRREAASDMKSDK